ncbi:metalloregulator ArsR/SmtB family transcription factor [Thioclava sp. GXIMD2076]|uniref:Metalloregulator ArsR/SmtB family transcription factor n=1 Tax=Thioclava kandeliae TaxID=3070818 RepID=A0ABV1SE65_9RHOB
MSTQPSSDLDAIFAALADPTRREILHMLLEDDMAVSDVASAFDISLAGVSKHLAILSQAGLISQEKHGRVKWCKLEPSAMSEAIIWIQSFGQFRAMDLDAFERFVESELAPLAAPQPEAD